MKDKIRLILSFGLIFLLSFLLIRFVVGCGGKQLFSEDLNVVSVSPPDKAVAVSISVHVSAVFNKALNVSTINGSTFTLSSPSGEVSGQVTYDAESKTATFIPTHSLANSTVYTAIISSIVKDTEGKTLEAPYTWSFTTSGISGFLDPDFGKNGVVSSDLATGGGGAGADDGSVMVIDSQKRIVVAGRSVGASVIWRFNDNGSPDATFGGEGHIMLNTDFQIFSDTGNCVTIDPQGKILVTGMWLGETEWKMVVSRFNNDGSLDASFGNAGYAIQRGVSTEGAVGYGIVLDSSNRILVTGDSKKSTYESDMTIWCLTPDGKSLDTNFGNDGIAAHEGALDPGAADSGRTIKIDSQGRILVAGRSIDYNTFELDSAVWRCSDQGVFDNTFGDGTHQGFTIIKAIGDDMALDAADKIYLTGAGDQVMCIWKLNANGSPDTSFGVSGVQSYEAVINGESFNAAGYGIAIDLSGRLLICGKTSELSYPSVKEKIIVWRCSSDGVLDNNFGSNGNTVYSNGIEGSRQPNFILVDSDGKILVVGNEVNQNGDGSMIILRYK